MNEKNKCNLELAKKLKELGVKQESEFYWLRYYANSDYNLVNKKDIKIYLIMSKYKEAEISSAFTVGELLNMLTSIKKTDIIIPVAISDVANYLAQEVINEKSKSKN